MKLRARSLEFETGGLGIIILNKADAGRMGLHALDRVILTKNHSTAVAVVDITEKFASEGEILTNMEVTEILKIKLGDEIDVIPSPAPESVAYIRQKITGSKLSQDKMNVIVRDVVDKKLSDIEMSAFVTALEVRGLSMDEVEYLSRAMVKTGKSLHIPGKNIVDKHSIGGIPGDKTSMLFVPIVAAAGLTIPKTSSRAITSPAGTADRMEVLAPVALTAEEIIRVVKRTGGCLVWGGALDIAPADDAFIKIEHPLGIDPLLLPSIMSKKKAMGSQSVVIDIPTGRGAKIKTVGAATELAEDFVELGKRLDIHISCAITFGEQPLGYCIGPALEAREALEALANKGPQDVVNKAANIVGVLFETMGIDRHTGYDHAMRMLKSGKAEKKFREIIEAQGGNGKVKVDDIPIGEHHMHVKSDEDGRILWMKNPEIASIARAAGAPRDKEAGIKLNVKMGDPVKKGTTLFTIYAKHANKLENAVKLVETYKPMVIGKTYTQNMMLEKFPTEIKHRRIFMLER